MKKLSPSCKDANFVVGITEGYGLLRDWKGEFVGVDDIQTVINALQSTVSEMKRTGTSQLDMLRQSESMFLDNLFRNSPPKNFIFYPTERKQLYRKGSCVYFVGDSKRPDRVKIGMTSNIAQRTKGLKHDVSGDVEVYAIFITPLYESYETALHGKFAPYNISGEWFQKQPVLDYVDMVRRQVQL